MNIENGNIVVIKDNGDLPYLVINHNEKSLTGVLVVKQSQNKYQIPLNNDSKVYFNNDVYDFVDLEFINTNLVSSITSIIIKINDNSFNSVYRKIIKFMSGNYFDIFEKKKSYYLPPSGKTLFKTDLDNLIDASLDMWLTTGHFNDKFEKALSQKIGVNHCLTVNSGSSANLLALTSLTSIVLGERRLKPGDEVITVAGGFPTTIYPIIQNGLVPVFVDLSLNNYNIDSDKLEEAYTEKTKAIMIAHTLGNPVDLDAVLKFVKKHNLWFIEDNCDALGSEYNGKMTGTFGHVSTCSFYPAHHITMGEGGAVLTNDSKLHKILLSIRDWGRDCWCKPGTDDSCGMRFKQQHGKLPYGYDHKYVYSHIGYNLKITDWQAAIGLSQLEKLDFFISARRENYKILKNGLKEFEEYLILPEPTVNSNPSWFGFLITIKNDVSFTKNELVSFLESNRVGTRNLFAGNILRQPVFVNNEISLKISNSSTLNSNELTDSDYKMLPITEQVMNNTFWIGLWPGLTEDSLNSIIETFRLFF